MNETARPREASFRQSSVKITKGIQTSISFCNLSSNTLAICLAFREGAEGTQHHQREVWAAARVELVFPVAFFVYPLLLSLKVFYIAAVVQKQLVRTRGSCRVLRTDVYRFRKDLDRMWCVY